MWINRYFTAMRDPHKGGLHIAYHHEISNSMLNEITENCLELTAKDISHPCVCVYSFKNGDRLIAMAKKITGNSFEGRAHDIIRAVVVSRRDFVEFINTYMVDESALREFFFPASTDYNFPEKWMPSVTVVDYITLDSPADRIKTAEIIRVYKALEYICINKIKIQLLVEEGRSIWYLAVLCSIADMADINIFLTADGECTLQAPDIMIINKIERRNPVKYKKMSFIELCRVSEDVVNNIPEDLLVDDPDEQVIRDALKLCKDYIRKNKSDYELYEKLDALYDKERYLYNRFISRLRTELFAMSDACKYMERYIKILYLAFKKDSLNIKYTTHIETAPYDYHGMYDFLRKKAKRRFQLKRMLKKMYEVQFSEMHIEDSLMSEVSDEFSDESTDVIF